MVDKLYIFPRENKGWIKIVEAVIAILLITGVLLILLNRGYIGNDNISERVYSAQLSILREIENNQTLRDEIIGIPNELLPVEWELIPESIRNKIIERSPDYLECEAKICFLQNICELSEYKEGQVGDIYSQSVGITANFQSYSPRQLKLFCWTK
jgi:hypothetical protein